MVRLKNREAMTNSDKREQNAQQSQNSFSNSGISQRDYSQESQRGGPSAGDLMMAMSTNDPRAYAFMPGAIAQREQNYRNMEMAAMMAKAGLTPDAGMSGNFAQSPESNNKSSGGGLSMSPALMGRNPSAPLRNRQQELLDFEHGMAQDRARGRLENSLSLEKQRQEQKLKMEMLQKLMMQFRGGSGGGGGEGYTSQIFNNAGAPQVVRLPNKEGGKQQQMLMQLLSKFGG